jgi:inositol-pentakisphosphate 2-kinase
MELPLGCRLATDAEVEAGHFSHLTYLGEGAANIIFSCAPTSVKISSPHSVRIVFITESDDNFIPTPYLVLRFCKDSSNGATCRAMADYYTNVTSHFFTSATATNKAYYGLLEVSLPLLSALNAMLLSLDQSDRERRKPGCVNTRIQIDDLSALLLPDLTPKPGEIMTIEIKPKWLVQSPNAPRWSLRCRTCALRAQRAAEGMSRGRLLLDHSESPFCPLTLVSDNGEGIETIFAERLRQAPGFADLGEVVQCNLVDLVADYFVSGVGRALLLKLQHWQRELDPNGFPYQGTMPHGGFDGRLSLPNKEAADRLKIAMTFRDCSMFVLVHYGGVQDPYVQAFLVDLDPKAEEKVEGWMRKEQGLINGGWYLEKEEVGKKEPESVCVLAKAMRNEAMWWL